MSWVRAHPSLTVVVALCAVWALPGLVSSPAFPLVHYAFGNGEMSIAEHVDLALDNAEDLLESGLDVLDLEDALLL